MKRKLFLLIFFASFGSIAQGQAIDTVNTYDFGKMPPAYFSNKVYWEKNYDKDNHLLFEALKYNSCFIGDYRGYWANGKLKASGQYLKNKTPDWTEIRKRGLCSVMDGEWKNFDANGELIKTVLYENGKITKEY
jgi:antitoxin component YwqK of YwqJK toxin-antitoxin module